ncbi:hypothetical protein NORO109296_15625 [Nocardiopsis rhodophaea]
MQRDPGELGVRVGVLQGETSPGEDGRPPGGARPLQAARRHGHRLGPGGDLQSAGPLVADEGTLEPVGLGGVRERPPALVAVPLLVDLRVVPGQAAGDFAAAVVGALGAPRGAVLAHTGGTDQVEGAGAEAIGGAGERAHRTDLHGVAGEVGLEGLTLGDTDLFLGAALQQLDEGVSGDFGREAGAPGALDAALAVKQDLAGQRDGLGEGPLGVEEPRLSLPGAHRLVLQRALAALVADGAVQRVVDQEELHDPALGLLRHRGGEVGLDDHPVHDGDGAGGLRFGHAAPVARVGDLDEALAAGPGGFEQRVVAEAGDLDSQQFGGADDQRALGHLDLEPVDGDGDEVLGRHRGCATRCRVGRDGHRAPPHTVERAWSNGHPPCSTWSMQCFPGRGTDPPDPPPRQA